MGQMGHKGTTMDETPVGTPLDLSLVPESELVGELFKRYDVLLLAGWRDRTLDDSERMFAWLGDPIICLGLSAVVMRALSDATAGDGEDD